jgi:hypothetical protein
MCIFHLKMCNIKFQCYCHLCRSAIKYNLIITVLERNSKQEGKRKRIQLNLKVSGNWNKRPGALKKFNPKLIAEEMINESENDNYLFI